MILVDGNHARRRALASFLEKRGLRVTACDGLPDPGSPAVAADGTDVLVVELEEAGPKDLEALETMKRARPGLSLVALAAADASEALLPHLDTGLIDHIVPAGHPAGVYSAVRAEELRRTLARTSEACRKSLRRLKAEYAGDRRRAMEIEEIYETTLENFMTALDLRDVETYGHSKTVARYSYVLAEALGIRDPQVLDNIRKGALLHDIGKIAIPDAVLKKPGPLTAPEWEKIRRHPALGYGLIKDIKLVPEVGHIILRHHERFDGAGYPGGLKGADIPLEARIFAVSDTLDAITSYRPYRPHRDFRTARDEITRNSGTQFDPAVVDAFCGLSLSVWEKIRFETTRIMPAAGAGFGPPDRKRPGKAA